METLSRTNQTRVSANNVQASTSAFNKFLERSEENRFGISPMVLLVMGIVGGIAAASGIMDSWVQLAAVAFPSTILLALILSVAPMRAIYTATAIALVLDLLVIII